MGMFDFLSKKSSNEGNVHDLIQTVRSDPKGRYDALVSLKKIGDPNAIDTFYEMLTDPSPRIRRISIEALGEMGNKTAIDHLSIVVDTKDFSKNGHRTNYGHPENITLANEAIRKIQQRSQTHEAIKIEIPPSPHHHPPPNDGLNWTENDIQLLRKSWGEGKTIQIMANLLKRSPNAVVHQLINIGLIGYNDDDCSPKPAHFGLSWDDQEKTQLISELHAGKSIPEIANIHERNKNSILRMMIKLKSINYHDRSILKKYTEISDSPDTNQLIRTLISELERNSNIDFRNHAATQLGSFHDPSVVNALIKCVENDPKVRYRALVSLRKIGDTIAIPVFVERSKDPSSRIRLISVNALGEIGDSSVIRHLESLIKSKDYEKTLKYGGNPENIQAARDAIQKIRSRERSGEPQTDPPDDPLPSSDNHVGSGQPLVIREYEFFAGRIRMKISVNNISPYTIHDVFLYLDIDEKILYLERHEPEYPERKGKIDLGNINPQNDRTVSFYLEPLICAKGGTDINCHVMYKDAQGKPGFIDMQPLKIQVVCPIFETKDPINVGMLKALIEELPKTDTKSLSVPHSIDGKTMVTLCRGSLQSYDIQHISTLRRESVSESWYYGRTKVTQKDTVIKLGIDKDRDSVEITAWSYDSKDLTGLLAELNRQITDELSKWGNVQKIYNISIRDSVLQRTNLLSSCDADGKCSGGVTIEDSVVMRSNIA